MEWKLLGSGDVPPGFESVQIDENNFWQYREVIRDLTIKALEDGTIKVCNVVKNPEETQSEYETGTDEEDIAIQIKEWVKSPENDVNMEDHRGFTKLMTFAQEHKIEVCKILISAGADLEKISKENLKTLILEDEHYERYKETDKIGGCTALHYAAMSKSPFQGKNLELCKLLISAGANISKETPGVSGYGGCTALHYAAKFGRVEICKLLVSAGADIHQENAEGWTPLMFAADGLNWETCSYFISVGGDVNKKSKDGLTLLMIALNADVEFQNYKKREICSKLVLMEPDMTKNTILNTNALACACNNGFKEIIDVFILLGADVDREDKDGWTPLTKAVHENEYGVCELLISSGANMDKEVRLDEKKPTTALMMAVNEGHDNVAYLFVKAGANTDKISKEKLEMLKQEFDKDTTSKDDNEETDIYDDCKNIKETDTLIDVCNLKINQLDNDAMTSVLEKCKELISAGAELNKKDKERNHTALINAAMRGYTKVCQMLIEAGADVNEGDEWGKTPLMFAARSGYDEICEMLISAGAKVDKIIGDSTKVSALSEAMEGGHIETCRLLMWNQAPIPYNDQSDDHGYTAVMHAAKYDMRFICEYLTISQGDGIEAEDEHGYTALMYAALWGSADACEFLLSAMADIEKVNYEGNTALMLALSSLSRDPINQINICEQLIAAGAKVDKKDLEGCTALMKTYNPEICQLLINAGADINLQDLSGKTALMKAAHNRQDKTCKLLIASGADIKMEIPGKGDLGGCTALHFAAMSHSKEVCRMLISAGADVDRETAKGWTALMFAAKTEWETCRELLKGGADVNKKSKDGWTPLMITMNENNDGSFITGYEKRKIAPMLLSLGADTTTEIMPNGRTLLTCIISETDFVDICEILILRGVDVNKENKDGWTPLMLAVSAEKIGMCEVFIAAGANVDKEVFLDEKNPATPLMLATRKRNKYICNALVSAGANILSTTYAGHKKEK